MIYEIEWLTEMFRGLMRKNLSFDYCNNVVKSIVEHIDKNKIKVIYPKNMFLEDKRLEMYVFTDRSIIISRAESENGKLVSIEVLNLQDIVKYKVTEGGTYDNCTLEIYFNCEDNRMIFNSKEDTNRAYLPEHSKVIKEIFRHLLNTI